jgi:elongation of very long chain fatty acids protein 6
MNVDSAAGGSAAFKNLDADFMGVVRSTIGEQKTFWDVEDNFDKDPWVTWLRNRWTDAFIYAVIYVVVVFGGQYLMRNKQRFELTLCLTLWNVGLAGFSIMGAIRCTTELYRTLTNKGLHESVVDMTFYDGHSGFWTLLFALSKLVELGDTVFIVLRKQNLIFLHWYHHIATLVYAWFSYAEQTGTGRWFVTMNFCIHSIMYSYYALKALKFKVPRFINVVITGLQTIQMIIGVTIGSYVISLKIRDLPVQQTWSNLAFQFTMYFSYLYLFSAFFYNAYIAPKKPTTTPSSADKKKL